MSLPGIYPRPHQRACGTAKRLKIALEIGNPSIIRANSDFEEAFSAAC
jgi:hypothetical protein